MEHIYLMFKTYFLYHQNAHFILEGVVTTFQVYIIIVFFMTTMVNMLTKSENFKKSKNNKKICNYMPSQLISFYLLISLEGMSTLIRSQGHQIESFFLFCFRSRFRSCLLIVFCQAEPSFLQHFLSVSSVI